MKNSSENKINENIKKEVVLGFGISRDFVNEVRENINSLNINFLKDKVLSLHPADMADLFEILGEEHRRSLASYLQDGLPAETLASLDEQVLNDVIENYKPGVLGDLLGKMDTDDAAYIIDSIEEERRDRRD